MKKIVLFVLLMASGATYGQGYLGYEVGYAFKKKGTRCVLTSLHAGYQLNNIIVTEGVALIEYNQRVLIGGLNPVFLGGRIGYGYKINEATTVALWGAEHYKIVASGVKSLNYWVPGYGFSFKWKNVMLDISNVEVYHLSIGCRYLFE